jgi:ADP-ribosylation factor GTPase-activating protein 1
MAHIRAALVTSFNRLHRQYTCPFACERGLGTHITFVRSVTMDKWTERQIHLMKAGGNQQFNDFLRKHGVDVGAFAASPASSVSIRSKYDSPPAELYKQVLVARIEGRPEPTELPPPRSYRNLESGRMQGFGSSPPPPRQFTSGVVKWGAVLAIVGVAVTAIAFSAGLLPH